MKPLIRKTAQENYFRIEGTLYKDPVKVQYGDKIATVLYVRENNSITEIRVFVFGKNTDLVATIYKLYDYVRVEGNFRTNPQNKKLLLVGRKITMLKKFETKLVPTREEIREIKSLWSPAEVLKREKERSEEDDKKNTVHRRP